MEKYVHPKGILELSGIHLDHSKSFPISAIQDKVIVRRVEKKENEFGLVIPDKYKEDDQFIGLVVSVGPKVEEIKVGDHVAFSPFAGTLIPMFNRRDDEEGHGLFEAPHLIMRESDIFGTIAIMEGKPEMSQDILRMQVGEEMVPLEKQNKKNKK